MILKKLYLTVLLTCTSQLIFSQTNNLIDVLRAQKAYEFTDAIGVCAKLDFEGTDSLINDWALPRLKELGIKHIRSQVKESNFKAYPHIFNLAKNGIKSTLFIGGDYGNPAYTAAFWLQQLRIAKVVDAVEALEGPNEPDLPQMGFQFQGLKFPEGIKPCLIDIWNTVKSDKDFKNIPIYGFTIGSGVKSTIANLVGDVSPYVDYGNFHYYKAWGQSYSEGEPDWSLQNIIEDHKVLYPNKTMVATEGSYSTTDINEACDAKYTLRFYLEYFRLGVKRIFKYELFDQCKDLAYNECNFGLIRQNNTVKPSFTALKNLISILKDTDENFIITPIKLNITISGENLHYILLQKKNGNNYLILWNDAKSWDDELSAMVAIPEEKGIITFGSTVQQVKTYLPLNSNLPIEVYNAPSSLNISIPDHPLVLEIIPTQSPSQVSTPYQTHHSYSSVQIYPNPASGELVISSVPVGLEISISDMSGRVLLTETIISENQKINISSLKSGVYLAKVGEVVKKISIQ
jgi:hypothetical protein